MRGLYWLLAGGVCVFGAVPVLFNVAAATHAKAHEGWTAVTPAATRHPSRVSPIVGVRRVGQGPLAVAVDDRMRHVFVANFLDGTITMLDTARGTVLRTTPPVALRPDLIAVDGRAGRVFIGDGQDGGGVVVLDAATAAVVRRVRIGARLLAIAPDERTGRTFVLTSDPRVSMLDGPSGRLVRTIPVGDGGPHAVTVDERDGRVLLTTDTAIQELDAHTGAPRGTVGTVPSPTFVAVAPQKGRIVVLGAAGAPGAYVYGVYVVDIHTGVIAHRTVVGGLPTAIAVDDRTTRIFVVDGDALDTLDARSAVLLRRRRIGTYPFIMPVVATRQGVVFVVAGLTRPSSQVNVSVLDATTGVVRRTIAVSPPVYLRSIGFPFIALAVSERTERAYVTNAVGNTVTVLDTSHI